MRGKSLKEAREITVPLNSQELPCLGRVGSCVHHLVSSSIDSELKEGKSKGRALVSYKNFLVARKPIS
jgi:hypothetical protein